MVELLTVCLTGSVVALIASSYSVLNMYQDSKECRKEMDASFSSLEKTGELDISTYRSGNYTNWK